MFSFTAQGVSCEYLMLEFSLVSLHLIYSSALISLCVPAPFTLLRRFIWRALHASDANRAAAGQNPGCVGYVRGKDKVQGIR